MTKGESYTVISIPNANVISMLSAYLEVFEVLWHNVCPHFVPIYNVPSMFRMRTRRSHSGSSVEALVCLLCRQLKPRQLPHERL